MQVEAVYEDGVLKPLQPLDLTEHEHVIVSVTKVPAAVGPPLDAEFLERLKTELQDAEPAPGLEAVRRRLAKIPGLCRTTSSPSAEIANRGGLFL